MFKRNLLFYRENLSRFDWVVAIGKIHLFYLKEMSRSGKRIAIG